jgi:ppGpp synthetase/RelA/SpoT-type nucleotidyltranferase
MRGCLSVAACGGCHVRKRHEWKSNDDGYYAVHFYVSHTVEVPVIVGGTRIITAWIELQITTQLQEVLRTFLHVIYEKRRMRRSPPPDIPWQWRYQDEEFFVNYLGHVLHNVEGMIMEVRKKSGGP